MKYIKWIFILGGVALIGFFVIRHFYQEEILRRIITRLEANSRAAEVLVSGINYNEELKKNFTTIKFLEYDSRGEALTPKYFIFPGNIIQFQSLVVRFDDKFVAAGDRLRGKSVYLFWKVFCLDGANTKEFSISDVEEVPQGYKTAKKTSAFEDQFWHQFWRYAFDKGAAAGVGVKNVQIEAPGTMFIPGYLYTIKIEHNGGLRIDTTPLPEILKGEKILLVIVFLKKRMCYKFSKIIPTST
ncbi:MAG: hypothetical protein HQL15_09050 [Candidatus Omnitrophica bacterium]|nr:hypothetical protein [Candidatus Omnitrophota bacterium]